MGPALLVNDNDSILERTAQMLHGLGWDVRVATSRKSALWICVARMPRLVVVDIEMNGGEGFEVISHVRRTDNDAFIVAVTRGKRDVVPFKIAGVCGASHHVIGPVSKTNLAEAIEVGRSLGHFQSDADET